MTAATESRCRNRRPVDIRERTKMPYLFRESCFSFLVKLKDTNPVQADLLSEIAKEFFRALPTDFINFVSQFGSRCAEQLLRLGSRTVVGPIPVGAMG